MADKITYSVKMCDSETAIAIVANESTRSPAATQRKEMGYRSRSSHSRGPSTGSSVGSRSNSIDPSARAAKRQRGETACMLCTRSIEEELCMSCTMCEGHVCAACSKISMLMMEMIATGAIPGFQWLCTGCTHGLLTMKNMTKTLNEIKKANEVRMNAIEKKLDQVCETIEARISKRFDEEMPGILTQVGSRVDDYGSQTGGA